MKTSGKKKVFSFAKFILLTALITACLSEFVGRFSFELITGKKLDFEERAQAIGAKIANLKPKLIGASEGNSLFSFHPYLGYSWHPRFLSVGC